MARQLPALARALSAWSQEQKPDWSSLRRSGGEEMEVENSHNSSKKSGPGRRSKWSNNRKGRRDWKPVLFLFLFYFFLASQGQACDTWKFWGEGLNQSCSCRPTPQLQQGQIWATSVLHYSSWQRQILNPLREARDRTRVLMDTSCICYHWATTGTPGFVFNL